MEKLRTDVDRMQMSDIINMRTVKERLRYLKNDAESCKSIPKDFRSKYGVCACVRACVRAYIREDSLLQLCCEDIIIGPQWAINQ